MPSCTVLPCSTAWIHYTGRGVNQFDQMQFLSSSVIHELTSMMHTPHIMNQTQCTALAIDRQLSISGQSSCVDTSKQSKDRNIITRHWMPTTLKQSNNLQVCQFFPLWLLYRRVYRVQHSWELVPVFSRVDAVWGRAENPRLEHNHLTAAGKRNVQRTGNDPIPEY